MNVVFFTAGTVGAGHLVRGLAIGNGLKRNGFKGTYTMIGPNPGFPEYIFPSNWHIAHADPQDIVEPESAWETNIAHALYDAEPDLLIVDHFWAPIKHILPTLGCEAWLLYNIIPDHWLVGPAYHPFEPEQYERIITIEPIDFLPHTHNIDPIVICNPDECQPPEAVREKYGVEPGQKLIVVAQAGLQGEAEGIAANYRDESAKLVTLSLYNTSLLFPSGPWLGGADHVVTGAGYNAFWEAKWLGMFDRTTFIPFDRPIDKQSWRVDNCSDVVMKQNGADVLARWVIGR